MRHIEWDATTAMLNRRGFARDNTEVRPTGPYQHTLFLHGSAVARLEPAGVCISIARWPTTTTRSRINAVLDRTNSGWRVYQANGEQYLRHVRTGERYGPLYTDDWYLIRDGEPVQSVGPWGLSNDRTGTSMRDRYRRHDPWIAEH